MAEKHRFKKNREFKKRLDEDEENQEADIRSFKFYSMSRRADADKGSDRKPRRFQRDGEKTDRRKFDRDDRKPRHFGRSGKPFDKKDKNYEDD